MAANEYDNSWLLDVYTYSDHPNVKRVVEELYEELMQIPIYKKVPSKKKVREHIKLVVLNLYDAYMYDPDLYVAYSMNENDYKRGRYNELHIGYEFLKKVIKHLKKLGYLYRKKGWIDHNTGKSRISRIQATTKLMEKIVLCDVNPDMVYEHPDREKLEEIIILRDTIKTKKKKKKKKKIPIDYEESITTTKWRNNLTKINRALRDTFIGLYIPDSELIELNKRLAQHPDPQKQPINFHAKRLHRIFNRTEEFNLGGRFYGGWWQNIPKQYRKFIRISKNQPGNWDAYDEEVIELDYDAMHARMLYKESIDKDWGDQDPFEIHRNNPEYRKLIKEAFYTMVNAETPEEARKAIQQNINYGKLPNLEMNGEQVIEKVTEHHSEISHEFGTGKGLRLQRKDSDIAERVMLEMLDQDWVVLPMHDSFIAPVGAWEALEKSMQQAFLDKFGMPCPISRKQSMADLRKMYAEHMDKDNEFDLENILDQLNLDNLKARVNPSRDRRDYLRYYTHWEVMQIRINKKAA